MFDSAAAPEERFPLTAFSGVTSDTLHPAGCRWLLDQPSHDKTENSPGISPGLPGQPVSPFWCYEDDDESFEDNDDLDDDEDDEYLDDEDEDYYDDEEDDDEDEDAYFFPDDD